MAKTTAPLFGFEATGTLGKSITFSKWRGVKYSKRYTSPANPNTVSQQQTRGVFASLNTMWKLLPAGIAAAWTAFATGRSFVNRNAFIGKNVKLLRAIPAKTTMDGFLASPGAGGGAPPAAMVLTPGDGQISVGLTLPDVPTGWTLSGSRAMAFIDQAPAADFTQVITYNEETVAPETNLLTGLTNDSLYVVAAFLVWLKPDGNTAYSVSLVDTATPAA